eukprot:SM000042S15389  [mRNA]  locus=s42:756662:757144:+ [translate_table: standard]
MQAQRITPFLWFDGAAEEAAQFYAGVFAGGRVLEVSRYGAGSRYPEGTALTVSFELEGLRFAALNGGPEYHFTEAISLAVSCETQEEVDGLWAKLTADGGKPGRCAWLKDKYGVSWQIVPVQLKQLLGDPDPAKAQRVMQAMMTMSKIDIAGLQAAHRGD